MNSDVFWPVNSPRPWTAAGAARVRRSMTECRGARDGARPVTRPWRPRYGQLAAKRLRKQAKSLTLRTGAAVEPSQLAYVSPAWKRFRKQAKSLTLRIGATVEL